MCSKLRKEIRSLIAFHFLTNSQIRQYQLLTTKLLNYWLLFDNLLIYGIPHYTFLPLTCLFSRLRSPGQNLNVSKFSLLYHCDLTPHFITFLGKNVQQPFTI